MDGLPEKTEKPSLRKWNFFRNDYFLISLFPRFFVSPFPRFPVSSFPRFLVSLFPRFFVSPFLCFPVSSFLHFPVSSFLCFQKNRRAGKKRLFFIMPCDKSLFTLPSALGIVMNFEKTRESPPLFCGLCVLYARRTFFSPPSGESS